MADPRRVAITGIGTVSAAGIGIEETWEALLSGRSFVSDITVFPPGAFPCSIAGQMDDFSARHFVPKKYRKSVKIMARDIELAVAASDLAFRDSGIETRGTAEEMNIDPHRLGCNIAAGLICADLNELGEAFITAVENGAFDMRTWGNHGIENLTPLWLLKYLPNMLSCHVTIIHGAEGPSNCITCGDAAGHLAMGESCINIGRGAADAVVVGGAESKLNPMGLLRQNLLGRLNVDMNESPHTAVRPFDAAHAGLVIGEGGGLLIAEELSRARERGARVYAEVAGFGAACDPRGVEISRPTAGNLAAAATKAIANAGITPADIDAIFTYGTGVPGEDAAEAAEWKKVFSERSEEIPAVALTGAVGSLFAGHSGFQLAAAAKAVFEQALPPTVNYDTPAENCRLGCAPERRDLELKNVIAGTYTVGGQSGACVLRRVEKHDA